MNVKNMELLFLYFWVPFSKQNYNIITVIDITYKAEWLHSLDTDKSCVQPVQEQRQIQDKTTEQYSTVHIRTWHLDQSDSPILDVDDKKDDS